MDSNGKASLERRKEANKHQGVSEVFLGTDISHTASRSTTGDMRKFIFLK